MKTCRWTSTDHKYLVFESGEGWDYNKSLITGWQTKREALAKFKSSIYPITFIVKTIKFVDWIVYDSYHKRKKSYENC